MGRLVGHADRSRAGHPVHRRGECGSGSRIVGGALGATAGALDALEGRVRNLQRFRPSGGGRGSSERPVTSLWEPFPKGSEKTLEPTERGDAMHSQNPTVNAYAEKISAQLQEAKAKIDMFEAKAKEGKAQAEIVAIQAIKTTKQKIDKQIQDLKMASEATVTRLKADLDADVAKLKASVDQLATKFKS